MLGCSAAEAPAPNAEPEAESAGAATAVVEPGASRSEAPPPAQLVPGSVQVEVGDFSATDVAVVDLATEVPTEVDRTRRRRKRDVERDPVAEAERRERLARRQEEFFDQLDDADPAARARAAEGLAADDRTIPSLSELAANDPDAGVRKAAVSALSDASKEDTAALDALIGALGDPDPQVVIAALDSIEWIGDASMIPDITPLLQHPNAEVREAAENSIYYLEE